jgi:acylphosphatase
MIKHYNINIYGRVQGVAFRYFTKQKAIELRVSGFVKNMQDGSVYIEAEAEEEILDQFYLWCTKGPSSARVDKIIFSESNISNFVDFKIK